MAFAGIGYGTMTAFAVLLFVQRGWHPAWLSFTAFAGALMVARVFFGSLPDRLGGACTAMIFIVIHSAGMALIWLSSSAWLAFIGAALAGFGYALVYPGSPWASTRPSSTCRSASWRRCSASSPL